MRCIFLAIIFFAPIFSFSQNNNATLLGRVVDEDGTALQGVSVQLLNKSKGTYTDENGNFKLLIPSNKLVSVEFVYTGFITVQKNLNIGASKEEQVLIQLKKSVDTLSGVTVKSDFDRRQSGAIAIDPSKTLLNPSPNNSIESLLKFFVGSSSELTSQYSVRGGSYDENLIYVNDFEVYRPYLIRNGQQEGLSFINPELTGNVKFFVGGFQAKYGDKMSSVLDITYKKPKSFGGSAYIGLLEQGLHLEGISKNNKLSYLVGVRNRSNRNLLSSQETKGNYIPSSSDIQGIISYNLNKDWNIELFANSSNTSFSLVPEEAKLSTSVFTPVFSANLGLDIYFQGAEKDSYSTNFIGFSASNQVSRNLKLKYQISYFTDKESENIDIAGAYLFGERDFDKTKATFGLITNPLGAGVFQNFARNKLDVQILNVTQKGYLDTKNHRIQWGASFEQQTITDKLNEWEYNDSAGYSLPYNPSVLALNKVLKGNSNINVTRTTGFIQDNIIIRDSNDFVINAGLRYNYNTLNNQLVLSPRVGISFKPKHWIKNVILKASAGAYFQPPFYREMRRYDGTLNTQLKAQQSWQFSAGFDYNFQWMNRPARVTTEAYYKTMTQVVPYDLDNVRLRYFGENIAKAYATGIETRLYAELVKGAESWLSVGIMNTKEKIENFGFKNYYNASGELITAATQDQKIKDSTFNELGYLRRPTDRLLTVGLFFQDYLSTNKNIKIYMSGIYGSNLPYNIPGSVKYRNALIIDPYLRIDLGFAALLLDGEKQNRRSHSPFRKFQNIWASLEIFNIIDRPNTISYLLIKDFQNNTFTIPNRLTPRMINLKLVARW